ncbi:phosphoglucosamine mutase [Sulfuricurvum sp. IAE1]|jgi:phosphoglucosamine mutase|uniref:phosphoglucosamine mutase n=1 Tax=Sulfuricurvum sp. IAE1 TaxID=2546102 RepID=UPI00104A1000|nr:phosphoglucosamine mutase [Sulfuricurvum sp. IAE1]MDD3770191.1 phosphoglucosamine mutase [Sulfuricurvum sp.]MDX9965586.1 phosphoglucosamine mutase [Sulfuricurvum sp.]TDA68508.1 phosphoglucosamine mutase [Sulfuricurvum sp. IAE1]
MKLFGTDGVRGEAGSFLTAELAMRVAMAAGIYFRDHARTKKILVGKDTRRSGYMIENAIVSGLTAVGYDVVQIGPMPTPAIAFLTENMRCDAGIMISASHNPYEDNGIKFFDAHGNKLSEEIEAQIEAIAHDRARLEEGHVTGKKIGSAKRIDDVIGRYIVQLKNSFSRELTLQGLRIVLDTANGAGYKVGPTVLEELGAEVIVLHDKPNGFNINEGCGALHTKDVREAVKQYRADIGLALDGDADRLIVVDENGEEVDGDQILGALGLFLHRSGNLTGGGIVATVMSNQALEDAMNAEGLKLFRSNVGDKYVLEQMRENGINFGGEQSGHIVMHDYAKTGDGLVSALQVLALLLTSGEKASRVLRPFELYPQKLVNIKVKTKKPLERIEGLEDELKNVEAQHMRHLIRYSGTENKLRILLEGKDAKVMEKEMERLVAFFEKALNA